MAGALDFIRAGHRAESARGAVEGHEIRARRIQPASLKRAFRAGMATITRSAPNVGQASRLPGERASASGSVPSALPTRGQARRLPYFEGQGKPPRLKPPIFFRGADAN